MFKFFCFFVFLTSLLYAQEDKVEIFATSMDSKENIVKAKGEVTVVYKDYFLSAKEAVYNRETGDLELFRNVQITHATDYKLLGNYAKLNIAKKEKLIRPFFMLEKKSQVWISADKGCGANEALNIKSGTLSGCNPNDPLWVMKFSSSDYNTQTKWLNLYNARVYLYDIPILYTPYFGYSLDKTRRTGLLVPSYGISSDEGFFFEQPIYIAEQNWWDLELKPQIRTKRGSGGYATFRFVDSSTSTGNLTTGFFKEDSDYFKKNDLAHEKHYGFNLKYKNSDFINQWFNLKLDGQSGIYADINNMNDVDYINLASNDSINESTTTLILSRVNLFYNTDTNYFGAYFKYYKDLTKQSNEDTLQQLPTIQYHHYLKTFLDNHLLYDVDIQSNNIYREINKKVIQTDLNVPITLQTPLFDEYLSLSYKTLLYAQHSKFSGKENISSGKYDDGYFARNYNILEVNSQLTRAYEDFTHTIEFSSKYIFDGSHKQNGYYEDVEKFCSKTENANNPQCDFYNITDINEEMQLDIAQYIFDTSGKQILYHRLAQAFSYEKVDNKLGELENELDYQITNNLNFYNNMFYDHNEHQFSKIFNKLSYSGNDFVIAVSHMYKDTFLEHTSTYTPYTSYITSSLSYTYNEHYTYHANWNYDLEEKEKKNLEFGFIYKKRCWDFGIKYIENKKPILTQSTSSSDYDRYLYFTIALKPLMQSGNSPLFGHKISKD